MQHLGSLLLVEVGGAGVEHHGLDGEVLGVLLPVALLHLALHLTDPCMHGTGPPKTNPKPMSDRISPEPSPSAHRLFDHPALRRQTVSGSAAIHGPPARPSTYHSQQPPRGRHSQRPPRGRRRRCPSRLLLLSGRTDGGVVGFISVPFSFVVVYGRR